MWLEDDAAIWSIDMATVRRTRARQLDERLSDVDATERGATPSSLLERTQSLIASVPLADRIRLLTGATAWSLHPLSQLGLGVIVVSDGPVGVRGIDEDRTPSAQFPSPSAVAATWDPVLAGRLGRLLAREAMRKNINVVLAPVVNLQRTPVAGRHFECFSEDPLLTARIATAYVTAAQGEGVALCVKHFVGNESETDRTTYTARIDERAMRETYLAPFEAVVREAGVWSVMAAYNRVDDGIESSPATEHHHLVEEVLKKEWGFDGVVISDWLATSSTVESANGGLDLVMPGPTGPWGQRLLDAVTDGLVAEDVINDKVERISLLGRRVGAGDRVHAGVPSVGVQGDVISPNLHSADETRALLRETVARSTVVLQNDSLLPLNPSTIRHVALIGPNAVEPFLQGGGSAYVAAPYAALPETALRDALPDATLTVTRGGSGRRYAPEIDPLIVTTPDGQSGYELTPLDQDGNAIGASVTVEASESWNRNAVRAASARIRADIRLTTPGRHRLEVGVSGSHTVRFDGAVVARSERAVGADAILDSSANHPHGPARHFHVSEPITVRIDARVQVVDAEGYGTFVRFALRHEPDDVGADDEIEAAVEAAAQADVAIVIVGTNEETESEGWDRQGLDLPGRQNELVRRVAAANSRTVVVVNAGAPVILPWLEDVAAVLWWWLPGQEAGPGLADALLGRTEPSGRLPWTLPAALADCPIPNAVPVDGVLEYSEGVHVGHRGWDRLGRTPARDFGYGLGYSKWSYERLSAIGWRLGADGRDDFIVEAELRNVSQRRGRETVQIYLEDPTDAVNRPRRWLAGFASIELDAGETANVAVRIGPRAFETWDTRSHSWHFARGEYIVRAGHSSRDLSLAIVVDVIPREASGAVAN
jgi:beta-glucosidase